MNKIFIISGPSGSGKGTIVEKLLKMKDLNLYWAKSYTTRAERASDDMEQKYIFVDEKKFKALEKEGEILESNYYNNNWYGTSKLEIDKNIGKHNIIKDIDVNGGLYYKKNYTNAVLIYITCLIKELKNRLIKRGQNTPEEIEERLKIAQNETKISHQYDFIVKNPEGHPEIAVAQIATIIKKPEDKSGQDDA